MKEVGEVDWKRFEKFLLSEGCHFKTKHSSHNKYKRPGLLRPIILPRYKKLPDFIILNNLRTLGVTREYFVKKMKDL